MRRVLGGWSTKSQRCRSGRVADLRVHDVAVAWVIIDTMPFTPLTDPPGHLLNLLADTTGAPSDTLDPDGLDRAGRYGWVYESQGRVALTGAR